MNEPPEYEDYNPEYWRWIWTMVEYDRGLLPRRYVD